MTPPNDGRHEAQCTREGVARFRDAQGVAGFGALKPLL
jgi:hypothetical protein